MGRFKRWESDWTRDNPRGGKGKGGRGNPSENFVVEKKRS